MLTTTVAGRTWNFSHAIGRNAAAGNGFTQPVDIAAGPEGVLYVLSRGNDGAGGVVAENKRIGKLTIDEQFIGDFGRRQMRWPAGLAIDAEGNLYCSEEYENRIHVFNEDGEPTSQWGESGTGDGQLNGPSGLAFDSDDNILVADADNNRVQKFTKDGQFVAVIGAGQLNKPWGMFVDGDDNLFVADWGNNRVQKFSPEGDLLLTIGGAAAGAGAELDHPAGVAVDSEGDVYVSDWGNKRIQIYAPDGSVITALYGDAVEFSKWASEVINSNPDAQKAYRRVRDRTSLGLFERPVGLTVDSEDRIIITDSTRGRLQVYAKEKNYLDPQFNL